MKSDAKLIKLINGYSVSTLKQLKNIPEQHLTRIVSGQLKSTIKAHGDITTTNLSSAAKRIVTQLLGVL